nr:hypothetical protein [Tanacetum cinerariifolium]
MSSQGTAAAGDPDSKNASSLFAVGSPKSIYRPECGVTNGSLLDTLEACQDLVDSVAPPGYFSELHMDLFNLIRVPNPPADNESRKRGRDGTDVNAPPKVLRPYPQSRHPADIAQ